MVPKKNIIVLKIIVLIMIVIPLVGCSKKNTKKIEHYKGLDQIILYEVPKGYKVEKNILYNDDGGIISIHYGNKKDSIFFFILSYKGKAVMGSDETFEDWYKEKDNIAEKYPIKNADTDAYIYPIGINTEDKKNVDKSVIEAVFSYKDYLIMVGMFNHEGEPITKDQKTVFSNLLKSIDFKEYNKPKSIDSLISYSDPKDATLEYYTVVSGDIYTPDKKSKEPIIGKNYSFKDGAYFTIDIFSYKDYIQEPYNVGSEKIDFKDYYKFDENTEILKTNFGTFYIESLTSDDMPDMVLRATVRKEDYVYEMVLSNSDEQYTKEQKEWFYNFLKELKEN